MNFFNFSIGVCLVLISQIYYVNGVQCGFTYILEELENRILGGEETVRGRWPFAAALYNVKRPKFFCGGTLISNRHILTAAHCIQGKGSQSKLKPEDIEVRLGAHNLTNRNENSSQTKQVIEVHIHPDWNVYGNNYDADLAILVLNESVAFTKYIRHVCLPDDDAITVGARATIIGWGLTENSTGAHSEIQREAATEVLDHLYCLTTFPHLAILSSIHTFCGAGGKGTPNIGDSGGGLFAHINSSWNQYGIISVLNLGLNNHIDVNTTAVYTSVKYFKDWINRIITTVTLDATPSSPVETEKTTPIPDLDDFVPFKANRHNDFEWKLTKALLLSDSTNMILSPFSVELLLSLLAEAAGPETSTHKELAAVLPSIQTQIQARELFGKVYVSFLEKTSNYELQIGTKIYVDESITPRQRYVALMDSYYTAKVEKLDFHKATESAKIINDWCANITKNNIKEFVNNVDVEDAVLIMVNALYFNGYWRRPFTEKFQKSFYVTPTTQVKTSFIAVTDKFYYTESQPLNAKLLRMPYKGHRFAMTIILPNVKGRLDELIRQLEISTLHRTQWLMSEVEIRVEIPKFKFDYTSQLNDVLKDIGVRSIFTNEAMLPALARGADVTGRLQVSKVIQKAGIFADDHGNAVNVATEDPSRYVGDGTRNFIADHPFIFIIEDETTGALLFVGKLTDPTTL